MKNYWWATEIAGMIIGVIGVFESSKETVSLGLLICIYSALGNIRFQLMKRTVPTRNVENGNG